MKWEILFTEEAIRDLIKLDKSTSRRIVKKLEAASADPKRYLEKLVGREDYKLRVGDYRILVILNEKKHSLIVEKVGHRRNIYKRLK